MIAAVEGLVGELRQVGIPVSASDYVDAVAGLRYIDIGSRADVKAALGATLIKDPRHDSAYSVIFDLYFAAPHDATETAPHETGRGGSGLLAGLDDDRVRALLLIALDADQDTLLRAVVNELVSRFADIRPGRSVAGNYYLFRVMRAVTADGIARELVSRSGEQFGTPDPLGELLLAQDYERRVGEFQRAVEAEIRRRMVADRGAADVARTLRTPLPEDADFLTASAAQIAELRGIVAPLARKLAAGLGARQRRRRRGRLDFRRTARASMSSGGVPMAPAFKRPRPAKPELVILADISGSVSAFAEFTLHLTFALRSEFTRVRSFVFIDTVDEVTEILARAPDIAAATAEINSRGCGLWLDGHSDYGNALRTFAERYGDSLRTRTTVLVLGDGRANYHASGVWYLRGMARRAGHVFWLNPEPSAAWNSGDSVMHEYAACCDAVLECRNVRQLRAFIEHLVLSDIGGSRHGAGSVRAQVRGLLARRGRGCGPGRVPRILRGRVPGQPCSRG